MSASEKQNLQVEVLFLSQVRELMLIEGRKGSSIFIAGLAWLKAAQYNLCIQPSQPGIVGFVQPYSKPL